MKFKQKPVEVEAFRWFGGLPNPDLGPTSDQPEWFLQAYRNGNLRCFQTSQDATLRLVISTHGRGCATANPGDWVVRYNDGRILTFTTRVFDSIFVESSEPTPRSEPPKRDEDGWVYSHGCCGLG